MRHMPNFSAHSPRVSWLIAIASVGVVAGLVSAPFLPLTLAGMQVLMLCIVLGALSIRSRRFMKTCSLFLIGMLVGFLRGDMVQSQLEGYERYVGQEVVVEGVISEDIGIGSNGTLQFRLQSVRIDNQSLPGTVWVSATSDIQLRRSDRLSVRGTLSEGFGNIPASLQSASIISADRERGGDPAIEFRDWFAGGIRQAIPEPEASLGSGFLLGQRSALPEDLDDMLRLLGLTHIVVASGYNLTILVRFARAAFAKISKYVAAASAGIMILSFLFVTGFSPSMSRAALVAGISLMAWYFGRSLHPLVLLPFAAAVTGLLQPSFVWGDLGWYLSFASFAGIMLLAPLLQHYFWGIQKEPGAVRRIIIETLSAQLATLPIIALMFGQYSPLAIPANVLVVPLIPLAMLLTFVGGIAGVSIAAASWIFGLPATWILQYMTSISSWLAQLPWAQGEIKISVVHLVLGYIALIVLTIVLWRRTRHSFRNDNLVV